MVSTKKNTSSSPRSWSKWLSPNKTSSDKKEPSKKISSSSSSKTMKSTLDNTSNSNLDLKKIDSTIDTIPSLILDSDIVPDDSEEELFLESKKKEISQSWYSKLIEELKDLEDNAISNVNDRIKEAREFGDLSENAEYQSAINEKQMLEVRISELKDTIANSIVVQSSKQWNTVQYGSTVTLSILDKQENITVTIVWSAEIWFEEAIKHISFDSPIGMAIEWKKIGDICKVRAERGRFDVKITKIA